MMHFLKSKIRRFCKISYELITLLKGIETYDIMRRYCRETTTTTTTTTATTIHLG
jgi:hypothetical protein